MLELHGVTAGYGAFTALWDVGLTVSAGEAVAVVGPNGAGKTTLLRAISGLIAPLSLVTASATAYLISEFADLAVFTPLHERRFVAAVIASSVVGLFVDSIVFLWLAFGSLDFLAGQVVGKAWMVLFSLPLILFLRRRDEQIGLGPA